MGCECARPEHAAPASQYRCTASAPSRTIAGHGTAPGAAERGRGCVASRFLPPARLARRGRQMMTHKESSMSAQPITFHACPAKITADRWPVDAVLALFELPMGELMLRAQQAHREHFDPTEVE